MNTERWQEMSRIPDLDRENQVQLKLIRRTLASGRGAVPGARISEARVELW